MNKNSSSRDTQFAGFAKWLLEEMMHVDGIDIDTNVPEDFEKWELLVAQRAYDLVKHTLNMVPHLLEIAEQAKTVEEVIIHVPDIIKSSEVSQ